MAKKKRHINSEEQLLSAMRSVGFCFPLNDFEQKASLKLQQDIDIEKLAKSIDAETIWNADEPKEYKKSTIFIDLNSDDNISKEWGIAAKGNASISKDILDKIKRNQDKNTF